MTDDPPDTGITILVSNRQDLPVDEAHLDVLARACLAGEGRTNVELSISLVDADEMERLHREYLGEPGPTDVLSFPLGEADGDVLLLGDVVICPQVAAAQAPVGKAENGLLLVHGILHLLGHDHEDQADRDAMWAKQERYSGVRAP
jgi:probable rRNA maturation factor